HFPISLSEVHADRRGLLYVLEPFQEGVFPLFHSVYPDARMTLHKDPYGRTMFVEIPVPKDEIRPPLEAPGAGGGVLAPFGGAEKWSRQPVIQRREPAIWLHSHWGADPLPHPFLAEWTTWLRIDQSGVYNFDLDTSGPTVVSFDRQKVFETSVEGPAERFSVSASAGRDLIAVS